MWLAQENGKLQLKNIASMMLPQKAFTPEEFALIFLAELLLVALKLKLKLVACTM